MTRHLLLSTLLLFLLLGTHHSHAQTEQIQDFTLTDAVSGQPVSLSAYQTKQGVVIIFTSNYCPYSKLYDNRIANLARRYPDVQVILVNPNSPEASSVDSFAEMQAKASQAGYAYPYLADKHQEVATMLGATKTPEAFLLRPGSTGFKILYRGAIDDNPQVESDVHEAYLDKAIKQMLSGNTVTLPKKRPTGCMIKKS